LARELDAWIGQLHPALTRQILALEGIQDLLWAEFLLLSVRDLLDRLTKLNLQIARQHEAKVFFQDVGDTAFARLTVDADHGFVGPPDVTWIDGQIRDLPHLVVVGFTRGQPLLDGVLMRAAESREYQLPR